MTLSDGRQTSAEVVGIDSETDLAVLHIELNGLPIAPIGDSTSLKVGDVVLAIGNPYNFGQTVTQGIVSATRRNSVGINVIEDFIQTDAAINPGNSGGPLFNLNGEVIGVNSQIYSRTGGFMGLSFAVPVNVVENLYEQLNLNSSGIFVTAVFKNSPAAIVGVMPGDIIIKVNGQPLLDSQQAIQIISGFTPGELINLDIIRNWDRIFLTAEVTQRPKVIQQ